MQDPQQRSTDSQDPQESTGKVDLVSVLYIVGGIPVIVLFLWVLFGLARACDIPA